MQQIKQNKMYKDSYLPCFFAPEELCPTVITVDELDVPVSSRMKPSVFDDLCDITFKIGINTVQILIPNI